MDKKERELVVERSKSAESVFGNKKLINLLHERVSIESSQQQQPLSKSRHPSSSCESRSIRRISNRTLADEMPSYNTEKRRSDFHHNNHFFRTYHGCSVVAVDTEPDRVRHFKYDLKSSNNNNNNNRNNRNVVEKKQNPKQKCKKPNIFQFAKKQRPRFNRKNGGGGGRGGGNQLYYYVNPRLKGVKRYNLVNENKNENININNNNNKLRTSGILAERINNNNNNHNRVHTNPFFDLRRTLFVAPRRRKVKRSIIPPPKPDEIRFIETVIEKVATTKRLRKTRQRGAIVDDEVDNNDDHRQDMYLIYKNKMSKSNDDLSSCCSSSRKLIDNNNNNNGVVCGRSLSYETGLATFK